MSRQEQAGAGMSRRQEQAGVYAPRGCTHHEVAELVSRGDGVVVEREGGGDPARRDVVGENVEAVVLRSVLDVVQRVLVVAHIQPVAHRLHARDERGERAQLALAQELLLAEVVEAQCAAHAHHQLVLERADAGDDALGGRLVQQLQAPAIVHRAVQVHEASARLPGVERQ
eukprot:1168943-Pyramimonas_sp.AAC.1